MSDILGVLGAVVVPAFLVIGVGGGLGRWLAPDLTSINRVALYAAVPCLVFTSLASTEVVWRGVGVLLAGNALFLSAMAGAAWIASRPFSVSTRRGLLATSMFSNAANLMLPITLFAFGDAGLQRALILYVFSALLLFTLGPVVLAGAGAGRNGPGPLGAVTRLPVVWAAVLGVLFGASSLSLPVGLQRGIELLGDAAIPLVLVALGLQIERTGLRLPSAANVLGATLKLGVGPPVGFLTAYLVGARGLDLAVLTLLAAMPPAVNTFMLAREFGGDAEEVAGTVVLSTFVALVSLSLVLVVLRGVAAS